MMNNQQQSEPFIINLTESCVVLTPNERLAAFWHAEHRRLQILEQRTTWATPTILPLNRYIKQLWSASYDASFTPAPYLLSVEHENDLWEKIILGSSYSQQLLQLTETASAVRSAYQLLKQWQISIDLDIFQSANDYKALQAWVTAYENYLSTHHLIDTANLAADLINRLSNHTIALAKKIYLVGFTELSPLVLALLACLEARGVSVAHVKAEVSQASCQRLSVADKETEIFTMARWARHMLHLHPHAKIACVLPSLSKKRDRVWQIFSEVFAFNDKSSQDLSCQAPFNISAGKKLSHYPMIQSALQLIQWLSVAECPLQAFQQLLMSPFVAHAEKEYVLRANFDRYLHQQNILTCDVKELLQVNHPFNFQQRCPSLAATLQTFIDFKATLPAQQSHAEWADAFCSALALMGWPGEKSLSSHDYQAAESWLGLLNKLKTFDHISPSVTLKDAYQALFNMASHTMFQAKTPDAPIQVLGLLEAAGQPFDLMWVAEMDDISWPAQPKPNPFIPKRLQRELDMPHATAKRELAFCTAITQQFQAHTRALIFSYAKVDDAIAFQASALIRSIPEIDLLQLDLPYFTKQAATIFVSQEMDLIIDELAPPVASTETIRGGANIIKQQALCPFKAFAEARLTAREIEPTSLGMRPQDRGNVLHKSLEFIWKKLQSQSQLLQCDEISLHHLIQQSIEQALALTRHQRQHFTHYMRLEKQRLIKLITAWLNLEKQRPAFKVLHQEKEVSMQLGSLMLAMRVDRIDELAAGEQLVIDYKTSKICDTHKWFDARPEEPQLPLYALLDTDNTLGISFAQLNPAAIGFKGISYDELEIKGIKPIAELKKDAKLTWAAQVSLWQESLHHLAKQFADGIANVDPKTNQTCEWCSIKPFCRIFEKETEM